MSLLFRERLEPQKETSLQATGSKWQSTLFPPYGLWGGLAGTVPRSKGGSPKPTSSVTPSPNKGPLLLSSRSTDLKGQTSLVSASTRTVCTAAQVYFSRVASEGVLLYRSFMFSFFKGNQSDSNPGACTLSSSYVSRPKSFLVDARWFHSSTRPSMPRISVLMACF